MSQTTIIRIHELGGPEVMKYETVPMPEPGPGEIRLRVEAIGIGFGECLYRMGQYLYETPLPSSIGNHAVGTVDAVGPGVSTPKIGERIALIPSFLMSRYAVYAEHAIVPASAAAPYFEQLSPAENASLWMQITTAYGALVHYGGVARGDAVLIHPASGGVGMASMQTCRKAGATAIGVTRSRAKAEAIREAGADHVIVTDEEDLAGRVREITGGKGVRLIMNFLTGDVLNTLADVTAPGGTIFMAGAIGGKPTPLPLSPMIANGIRVQGYTLYELTYHEENLPGIRKWVSEGVRDGFFRAQVGKVFPFREMVEAHRYLEKGETAGSVVVLVGER